MNTVYISGPIKGHDDFVQKFAAATNEVAPWANPVNPVDINPCKPIAVDTKDPHFGKHECDWPGEMLPTGHTWQCYMRGDIEVLVRCHGIYMMRGWETSKGATEELRIAQMLGMDIYFQPALVSA